MRFTTVFSALVVTATSVAATATYSSASVALAGGFTKNNCYGAPIPPWKSGHHPGWYYGSSSAPKGISSLDSVRLHSFFCKLLSLFPHGYHCPSPPPPPPPHSPPPPPPYTQVEGFYNLDCAAQDGSYLTYGLVDTVDDCYNMCASVSDCTFFNTYHDVNGKDGSSQLTCSLFSECLTSASADNCGGQTQSDGSVDYITDSTGYCTTSSSSY
ncbi:Fruit-body specific protein a [Mycena sanguinolenta]|uniref:Fruit-body specific protein a n=1 Tax=Mycena sanguinolenta TaxID=230812 RepID=A0A8H7CNL4_9AGAR|nr:Fruit-body specific protein a [Mycena sanguinolenta]